MERFLLSTKRFIPKSWAKVFKQAVESSDAYFVPGGSNIPAKLYGKKQFVEGLSRTPSRSLYELSLLAFLLEGKNAYLKNKPEYLIIGFCYGFQALNVAMGGTLYQSIPIEAYGHYYVSDMKKLDPNLMHMNFHLAQYPTVEELYRGWFHRIKIYQKSKFILKLPDVYILSNHHQGAAKLGKNLIVLAASIDDKIPEILAHKQFPNVIGLQGHIERQFALDRLSQFPENTRKFHEHFWTTVSQVLMHNFQTRQKK